MTRFLPLVAIVVGSMANLQLARATAGAVPHSQTQTIQSPSKNSAIGRKLPSSRSVTPFLGGIDVTLSGIGDMLITDPLGRRAGTDAITGKSFAEIPGGAAGDDSIDDPTDTSQNPVNIQAKELEVSPVLAGTYKLTISTAASGSYGLDIAGFSREYQMRDVTLDDIPILAGTRQSYLVRPASAPRGGIELSGGFDGGVSPRSMRPLLTYASPSAPETKLPVGTRSFPIVVFYDSRIVPQTFAARLEGRDISRTFHPVPGKFERVFIPAHPGLNIVVLTVQGDTGSNVTDRFAIVVP
ncbi:MAG: hypothetical protein M1404_02355 [Acidobacteria bacterium]|nr:hypothetical protein [Acidobacteriota bacterium]